MALNEKNIRDIAHLARLKIEEDEVAESLTDFSSILSMISEMQTVDTENIAPLANPHEQVQKLRKDAITESNDRDNLLNLAPKTSDGLFLVPKVID
jgi:aspartyl-tRNA(Asn)/glutamyl-tRNA(Gln) amidotransferase subunit C|tara:strand:+ start:155 stop:442 length:288 start_codon:yes stop_codon:yes gene_type:complete